MRFKGYSRSVIGGRESNQDAFMVLNDRSVFAVADGVGGGVDGDVASKTAVETVRELVHESTDMRPAFLKGQDRILKDAIERHGAPLMGTTLTAVHGSSSGLLTLCHVGDSRCYIFRNGCLEQITEDQEYYDESVGSPVLASYLGIPSHIQPLNLLEKTDQIAVGNRIILCSDGLYKQVEEPRIVELINLHWDEPEKLLENLTEEAAQRDHSDNITIVYIEVLEDEENADSIPSVEFSIDDPETVQEEKPKPQSDESE